KSFRFHLIVQRNGIPIVPVRPCQGPILDEHAAEISGIFQRLSHGPSLLSNEAEVAHSGGSIRELDFEPVATEVTDTNNIDHHSSPSIRSRRPSVRAATQFCISALRRSFAHSLTNCMTVGGRRPSITSPSAIRTRARNS